MFTIRAAPRRLCCGLTRRDFLQVGSLGGLAVASGRPASASRQADSSGFGRAKRAILLFLTGGPPQLDTWDPKPEAPAQIRGELRPIDTNVPGIRLGELFPRLARRAHRFCIVRSVTHGDNVHTSAGYTMLTGVPHPMANAPGGATNIRPTGNDHPHVGSLLALRRGRRGGVPVFAVLPEVIKDAAINTFPGQGAGFLGERYSPFQIHGDPLTNDFRGPDIVLPDDVTADRLADRRLLAGRLDELCRVGDRVTSSTLDGFRDQAFALIRSPAVRRAFELQRETDRLREEYGRHLFGQGCLLARRLLEAGVALVTVYWHYEGPDDSPVWDTHENNFSHLRNRLAPPTDRAFAALLDDLATRGLLADTLVICMGEFGRSPRINSKGGREHWAHVQSVVLAGAGIRGGSVYGASDQHGAYPVQSPVTPAELTATILHLLGVPLDLELTDRTAKPVRACDGAPVRGLVG